MPTTTNAPKTIVVTDLSATLQPVLAAARLARCARATVLVTRDRDFALAQLCELALRTGAPLVHCTVAGRREFDRTELRWRDESSGPAEAVDLLNAACSRRAGIVILEDCLYPMRDEGGNPQMRMALARVLAPETEREGLVLVFLDRPEAERHIPSILSDQLVRIVLPYPRATELEAIAREEMDLCAHRSGQVSDVPRIRSESGRLASGVVGLTRSAARDALRDALAQQPTDYDGAHARLQVRKAEHLRRELAMNILDGAGAEMPVGLDYLFDHVRVAAPKMRLTGQGRARGVLLIGPPGTGKTMLARAVGRLVDLPVVEFRISSLMNSLLGETERRFAQAFATLEAMAPNVVFIDEIEKAFGDSGERDGGTMMRVTGALLSWLNDNQNPNFVVGTANNLARMGEIGQTMTRSGRFDTAFFVDVPCQAARAEMLRRWLPSDLDQREQLVGNLAEQTPHYSGADLRSAIDQAAAAAEYAGVKLGAEHLLHQFARKRNRAQALYGEFAALRQWGRVHCDPAGPTDNG